MARRVPFETGRLWGAGDFAEDQRRKPTVRAPFPSARGYAAIQYQYDLDLVRAAAMDDDYPVSEVDPRELSSTQPSVTPAGVHHYTSEEYERTGETYADANQQLGHHSPGNRVPIVYRTADGVEDVIMSGHHRATAALLQGRMLNAKVVEGPWELRRSPSRQAAAEAAAKRRAEASGGAS